MIPVDFVTFKMTFKLKLSVVWNVR